MTKLLLISYLFPPMGGIAVQRALSFAKFLPDNGFEVHVLRAKNAAGPVIDPALLSQVPASVRIHDSFAPEVPFHFRQRLWRILSDWKSLFRRTGSKPADETLNRRPSLPARVLRRILCPEPEILWFPFAYMAARRVVEEHDIDIVMVTAPPFSAFLVGNALKRRFPRLKLVQDFRDEWIEYYLNNNEFQGGEATRRRALEIEAETVRLADLVIAVTHSSRAAIQGRYPDQPAAKFAVVSNGYDPDLFKAFHARPHGRDKILVTHVGTVYHNSSPRPFFEAVRRLAPALRDRLDIRFIGRVAESERAVIENAGPRVSHYAFMPQREAVRHMEETDFLLLVLTDNISIPGKVYEYLATGKPIVALSPPGGEVERLMAETGAGFCVDPGDIDAIARAGQGDRRPWRGQDLAAGHPLHQVLRATRPRGPVWRAHAGDTTDLSFFCRAAEPMFDPLGRRVTLEDHPGEPVLACRESALLAPLARHKGVAPVAQARVR